MDKRHRNKLDGDTCVTGCLPDCEFTEFSLANKTLVKTQYRCQDQTKLTNDERDKVCRYMDLRKEVKTRVLKDVAEPKRLLSSN